MFFRCSVPKLTVAMVPALLSDSQENNWRMNSARGQGHSVTRHSAQRFTVILMGAASPLNRRQRNPNMHETGSCDPVKSQEYSRQMRGPGVPTSKAVARINTDIGVERPGPSLADTLVYSFPFNLNSLELLQNLFCANTTH